MTQYIVERLIYMLRNVTIRNYLSVSCSSLLVSVSGSVTSCYTEYCGLRVSDKINLEVSTSDNIQSTLSCVLIFFVVL